MSVRHCLVWRWMVALTSLAAFQTAACAAGFLDDFNDGNVQDNNPVLWVENFGGALGDTFAGTYDASTGDYRFIDPNPISNQMISFVNGVSFSDVHIRTQGMVIPNPLDPTTLDEGNLAILARLDPATLSGYVFYFDTDFNLGALVLVGGDDVVDESFDFNDLPGNFDGDEDVDGNDFLVWQQQLGGPGSADADASGTVDAPDLAVWQAGFGRVQLSPLTEVVFEASVVGNVLSARVWPVGQARPEEPQFTYTDEANTFTSGLVGLGYDDDAEDTTGVYRFFEARDTPIFAGGGVSAVPEPTGLASVFAAALTAAGVLRKRSNDARQ
jgi:hypothetical protein